MKRIISILVCLALLAGTCLALSACNKQGDRQESQQESQPETNTQTTTIPNSGGWAKKNSTAVTDDIKALVQKACETLTGAAYTPIAYLESQVVAGYNHLILCKITPTVPNATSHYALVTIYENLEGGAEITSVVQCKTEITFDGSDGAWSEPNSYDVADDLQSAFKTANSVLAGAQYTPLALLATQTVAGTNYLSLCEMTPTVPDAASSYEIVTLYQDLNGNVEITETAGFNDVQS